MKSRCFYSRPLEIANDESYDAVWRARGGYGSCRVAEAVMRGLTEPARRKAYVGYGDAGTLFAGLYRAGFEAVAHGPVAEDILRDGGEVAVGRALAWLVDAAPETLDPTVGRAQKTAGFNMSWQMATLSHSGFCAKRGCCGIAAPAGGTWFAAQVIRVRERLSRAYADDEQIR